jgi:hypothetical protein
MATVGDLARMYNQVDDLREKEMIPEVCFAEFRDQFRLLREVLVREHQFESVFEAAARTKPETPLGNESQKAYDRLTIWLWKTFGITA